MSGDETLPASGSEVNLGDFTRTQGLMKSLRLTLDNQIIVQVEEIASGLGEAGRKFKMGDLEQANLDVARLYAAFGQKTMQWENQAKSLEQQMRTQAAKNPKSISIDKMNRMKSEQTSVRTRIRTAEVQFRRLHQGLEQSYTLLKSQPVSTSAVESQPGPLSAFLASFRAASPAERERLVKEPFAVAAILKATVTRNPAAGYDIKFDPLPPTGRLYYATATAQLFRLIKLASEVTIEDLDTNHRSTIRLVEFVKQIQTGMWLLEETSQS